MPFSTEAHCIFSFSSEDDDDDDGTTDGVNCFA